MRRGILASAALHAGIIGATLIAWPRALDLPADDDSPIVPVDVVTVAEETNVAPAVTAPQPAPPPEQPLPPAPPEPKEEAAPPPPDVAPTPEPKPVEQAEQNTKPPRIPAIPKPRPEPDKPSNFNVDTVIALLDKSAPKPPPPPPANAPVADQTIRGIGAQTALTADIKDALLAQMRECWNVPVGAPHPEQLIVQVRVFLAPDGHLAQPPQLTPESKAASAANSYMRAASEAALRAINKCEPYKYLPADKYDAWREIVMTFDPSKMVR